MGMFTAVRLANVAVSAARYKVDNEQLGKRAPEWQTRLSAVTRIGSTLAKAIRA